MFVTISKGIKAHQKFQSFSFHVSENIYQIRQLFDGLVTECFLQGIVLTKNQKTSVLVTHPTDWWLTFIESVSLQVPLPMIFQQMTVVAEKWDAHDEKEHMEANVADSRRRT